MKNKFSLLSVNDEPTDEQLHLIMAEALLDAISKKKKGDEQLKHELAIYKEIVYKKYHYLIPNSNG